MKTCRIREDLLNEELGVPVGEGFYRDSAPIPYRWAKEEWEKEEEAEFEVFHEGVWQSAESADFEFGEVHDLQARIAKLPDVYCFTQNLCALTEMKECDHNSSPDMDIKLSMCDNWDAITECAMEFTEKHIDTKWDGDWYEALEVFYAEKVRRLLFEI